MTVIVGAGLAGLVCARLLAERGGAREFLLLEAEAEPGGRVRSQRTAEGYTLDRGFQVLLDSYPAVRRHLDLAALAPRYFGSGAILAEPGTAKRWLVSDPRRHPGDAWQTALTGAFPLADKARLLALVAQVLATPDDALLAETRSARDVSTAHFLWARGFSPAVIERFLRPFFGGVFLDDRLATSAGLFRYYLKKFSTGRALLPALGMGEIPRQLARDLPPGVLRLNCRVARIETAASQRATAVVTESGERIPCDRLLLATDPPAAARLLGKLEASERAEREALGDLTLYFSSAAPLYPQPLLVLPAGRGRLVRDFAQVTNVAPEYAPPGRHLLSATVLDRPGAKHAFDLRDDDALFAAAQREIAAVFPTADRLLEPLAVVRIRYGQRPQPAGFARDLTAAPAPTHLANVWRLGDGTTANSIQTAMTSGEQTAKAFLAA
ncbi:MAG: FAD-dependent oxidoreductase [Verrucomicrobia bacterium]|nr:FAD-dependent oxidoreductase [Verrucomicrobiota bacterium]